jgi:hypothetical protein
MSETKEYVVTEMRVHEIFLSMGLIAGALGDKRVSEVVREAVQNDGRARHYVAYLHSKLEDLLKS